MMPAGDYWVGDLCYVMHDRWDEVCELLFEGRTDHGCNDGEFTLKDGTRFAIYSTMYGDGTYYDNWNHLPYGVDSGSIGCILVKDISKSEDLHGGYCHCFTHDFYTGELDGRIMFDSLSINTSDDVDEDEEDEDY